MDSLQKDKTFEETQDTFLQLPLFWNFPVHTYNLKQSETEEKNNDKKNSTNLAIISIITI